MLKAFRQHLHILPPFNVNDSMGYIQNVDSCLTPWKMQWAGLQMSLPLFSATVWISSHYPVGETIYGNSAGRVCTTVVFSSHRNTEQGKKGKAKARAEEVIACKDAATGGGKVTQSVCAYCVLQHL